MGYPSLAEQGQGCMVCTETLERRRDWWVCPGCHVIYPYAFWASGRRLRTR